MAEVLSGDRRREKARDLRVTYEAGASIRSLAARSGLAYGTVRKLLLEAGTTLRGRGGNQRDKAGEYL
ncbi:helix-turn-helix domain-containing protein [Streptomyces sp. NRRL B-1347]|uniref:helix-turn-helix domain-containing protein n=1 Tax=Streptomyces sp. NRRL B-1347 TaxID=1476877 RepID=UPI0004CA314B|nr:helix-turn-helix domain-containing protein [Streptomyces sp. NRRL B-1347]